MNKKFAFLFLCIFCFISCGKFKQKVYYIVDNQLSENVILDYECFSSYDKSGMIYVKETVPSGSQKHLIVAEEVGYVPIDASHEPASPSITFDKFCILKINGDTIYSRKLIETEEDDDGDRDFLGLWKSDYKVGQRQTEVTWTLILK